MSLEFLGTGTSVGVPVIGCDCAVCHSTDPRDKRLRSSALVRGFDEAGRVHTSVLIDTTPDFRQQMLRANIRRIDGIVITHFHADHVTGIDDVRRFNVIQKQVIDVWGSPRTLASLRKCFGYVFSDSLRFGWPSLVAREINVGAEFQIGCLKFLPFDLDHEVIVNTGLKITNANFENSPSLSYCLDVKRIDEQAYGALAGTDTLVLDMLRETHHPTHMNLAEALDVVARVKPRRTYFGHIAHEVSHAELEARLPAGVHLAYDGLVVEV
ncbi:MAG TPA: MBL fold metallo-hydrolase [Planctomycetota bacterium]|nr:MBL fold metallo-hydrolase [Planctomycetota bacterium]